VLSLDPDTKNSDLVLPIRSSQYLDYHLYRLYHSAATKANAAQRTGYGNPEVDRLIDEARKVADPAKRNPLYQQAEKLIWDDVALLWVVDLSSAMGNRKSVTGWEYLPLEEIIVTNVEKA
jgi:peptide/nickel transport system substrate-binding protein